MKTQRLRLHTLKPPMTATFQGSAKGTDTSAAFPSINREAMHALLRRYRLGLALLIAAQGMLFVAFSSAYIVRRAIPTYDFTTGTYSNSWDSFRLPTNLLLAGTFLLISSSSTMELARRRAQAALSAWPWIGCSLLLSLGFLVNQGLLWNGLHLKGYVATSGARAAFFYVFAGTHAAFLLSATVCQSYLVVCQSKWKTIGYRIAVDLSAWYVHAMTAVWIYVLLFLVFA